MKPRVHIDTSVVSYLTARNARDVVVLSRQAVTRELWDCLAGFDAYISELVVEEAAAGDAQAAAVRLAALEPFSALSIDGSVRDLAALLIMGKAIPSNQPEDALHLAVAAANGMDVIVTWNFKHINNPFTRAVVRQIVENAGYACPEVCSPEELLQGGDVW